MRFREWVSSFFGSSIPRDVSKWPPPNRVYLGECECCLQLRPEVHGSCLECCKFLCSACTQTGDCTLCGKPIYPLASPAPMPSDPIRQWKWDRLFGPLRSKSLTLGFEVTALSTAHTMQGSKGEMSEDAVSELVRLAAALGLKRHRSQGASQIPHYYRGQLWGTFGLAFFDLGCTLAAMYIAVAMRAIKGDDIRENAKQLYPKLERKLSGQLVKCGLGNLINLIPQYNFVTDAASDPFLVELFLAKVRAEMKAKRI